MLARHGIALDAVIELRVDEEALIRRIESRIAEMQKRGEPLRPDDNPDVLHRRLTAYREQTAPLIAYYRDHGMLRSIDGMAPIDQVAGAIEEALNAADPRPVSKPESKPTPKPAAKTALKSAPKPALKSEPVSKPASKPSSNAAPKAAAKAGRQSGSKTTARALKARVGKKSKSRTSKPQASTARRKPARTAAKRPAGKAKSRPKAKSAAKSRAARRRR